MSSREIAYEEGTIARQDKLPYPFVYYPGHYGTFFAFRKIKDSPLTFCLCSKEAIENYIEFQTRYSKSYNSDSNRNFILDVRDYPVEIAESLREKGVEQDNTIIDYLNFEDNLSTAVMTWYLSIDIVTICMEQNSARTTAGISTRKPSSLGSMEV